MLNFLLHCYKKIISVTRTRKEKATIRIYEYVYIIAYMANSN